MDTDESIVNNLFHSIENFLLNLNELVVLNFKKSFCTSVKNQTIIHDITLVNLSIWLIARDFQPRIIEDMVSLSKLP